MKKLTEKEIQKRATEVLKDHPKAEIVFISEDGHAFLGSNHADALTHARRSKVELHEVANPAINQEKAAPAEDLKDWESQLLKREAAVVANEQRLKSFDSDLAKLVTELHQKQAALEAREKALAEKEAKASEKASESGK